jgi:hypothetical protein
VRNRILNSIDLSVIVKLLNFYSERNVQEKKEITIISLPNSAWKREEKLLGVPPTHRMGTPKNNGKDG